mmetsp:Transcript_14262/g.19766  ORF Transcript_14262/g.19766 Transcript_14262/m.19766 type:complete len:139 (+) Transcript_14262:1498-1914(+)|eukprot:CAMPEP_0201480470 /NCGR_PEP_ID=MMETSP0151_2-20130828/4941_1 /ASSEMBLY_ACC=CAM_ASM_000257 /TAXON_ID=200890 /ORGANISM="Paramoeba atlantica, Strain 621/1 / CCAP 1560/9" /LENGTH=138 /DNA_ID=CAMNT_0047862331 /DNA_START=78 /DNA_END=494 /DNA_ORIENTATION=-
MSGIQVTDEVVNVYNEIKMGHKHKYALLRISDNLEEVIVEKTSNEPDYATFVAELPKNDCRYAIYDLSFQSDDGGERSKILFVVWAPDSAKIKQKMLITSTKDSVKKKLVGIGKEIQATDLSEIALEEVTAQVLSTAR